MEADLSFMLEALEQAQEAARAGEIPVGAVIVRGGAVIARGRNRREALQDPTAHAEMLALREAARGLNSWRLNECALYVTLEPCIMCVGAILQARIQRLVFGPPDPKAGAVMSLYRLCEDARLNHRVEVVGGVLAQECGEILANFFSDLRRAKKTPRHLSSQT
ncbi:MAG TPA: tRNA adenosine(34) deaminase TadA [Candidatus Acidoferrales bacterium]|nr:tRNA adenosine(34) deaminase TadA [Candidatus Acidoferrales bacterium]